MEDLGFYLIIAATVAIIIFGAIIAFVIHMLKRRHKKLSDDKNWYLRFSSTKEDGASQVFFLFSFFFAAITLFALNKNLGNILSWSSVLLLGSALGFGMTYKVRALYTLPFSIVGIFVWWSFQAGAWIDKVHIQTSAVLTGAMLIALILYVVGRLHDVEIKFKRVALMYTVISLIGITLTLFFFSTRSGIDALGQMTRGLPVGTSWELVLSFFCFAILLVVGIFYAMKHRVLHISEALFICALALIFGILVLVGQQQVFYTLSQYGNYGDSLSPTGIIWMLVFNATLFVEIIGFIFLGYIRQEPWMINLGVFFSAIFIITKYFDWFFTLLDRSIFFISVGILLLLVGWSMEKGRRYMLSLIKTNPPQAHM